VDNSVNPVGGSSLFEAGLARECGWEFVATALASDCSPGETVVLSCPSCDQTSEDPMLRVCEGNRACVAQTALAAADDTFAVLDAVLLTETPTTQSECEALANTDPFRYSCYTSSPCPTVQFTCPAGGVYTALSASEDPNAAAACEATRPAAASPDAGL